MADGSIEFKLSGREVEPRLPAWLRSAARSADQADDPFLPPGYLTPRKTFDVSAAARSAEEGMAEREHRARPDEVVVLELADGSTYVTSAQRLQATLAQTHPELLGPDGEVLLEKLREASATSRGMFGEAIGGLVSKVFTFALGEKRDEIVDEAIGKLGGDAELGVSWAGTKALMWAIEKRLKRDPGLYRWTGATGSANDFEPAALAAAPAQDGTAKPMLVFVHGTASSTMGSFGDLRTGERDVWAVLERKFTGGIYAFEHRTLSESPIENALQLAEALPRDADISLVSHSRGGLVADLLCLGDFDALIDRYSYAFKGIGEADPAETKRVLDEMRGAHAEHRDDLRKLAALLRDRRPKVRRYVRAASPAQGTLLASGNFDLFLSGLLTLIGQVPFFFGSPLYSAFKRVVLEIAKNRTDAHLVPGIEAMLPESPMARLLRDAPVRAGIDMAVIAGDIQGGNLLKRLGVLLTDFLLFENTDNDLVVDTPAMLAGIAPAVGSRVLFDRGADVSHFRYFTNHDTRVALRDWLTVDKPEQIEVFHPLPSRAEDLQALQRSATRDAASMDRPVAVVLPGVMGSHLCVNGKDRVWFDPGDIATGGLEKIMWAKAGVEAEDLFSMFYGKLCEHLSASHRVEHFAYDWRQPLDVLAERLGQFLDRLLNETDKPIRLLAHSMGGLVVRACIHKRRSVMDALMQRDGARLVMLGTPNQGAHSMVENLLGKGSTLRTLVRLDLVHDMQQVLDIVAGFRGALQLLPKPGFKDIFQGQSDGGGHYEFQNEQTWLDLNDKVRDYWFGDRQSGKPSQAVLDAASWLWAQDGKDTPALPAGYEKKAAYVFGVARNTPCGVREESDGKAGVRLKMVGTTRGDGTVTWQSGRIAGIGEYYYMPAEHGDLTATKEYFPALVELLVSGTTSRLMTQPPAVRDIEQPQPVIYDAGPPTADDADAIERTLLGGSLRRRTVPRPKRRLEVAVKAADLRFLSKPILVGHYEQDPIAGPEGLIDRELLEGDLSERYSLGLYAGPRGTATVVLRVPNELERQRGTLSGAVVTGLGPYDGAISLAHLTEAVRTGVLRYLLQVIDVLDKTDREVSLATLLLGYNSAANLTVGASVEALVRGVIDANAKFNETTRLNIRVGKLEIVELYLDTAITAVYELRRMAGRLALLAEQQNTHLVCRQDLLQGDGMRQRLFDSRNQSYWPRLSVTDADRPDDACPPECYDVAADARNEADDNAGAPAGAPARPRSRIVLADRLRYLYIGQRARAESVAQQRQPGLIETLVRQQIHNPAWQEDIGRMLFQLMVPHDFKDAARQMDRLVLVVDSYTANLPWELMLADDPSRKDEDKRPLALRTAVVRQLSSTKFRRQVRQVMNRSALVVGNPSVEGFVEAFPGPASRPTQKPPVLQGAQTEAEAVAAVLKGMDYTVQSVIGDEVKAVDVLAKLYHEPYRFLHISAHGVFGLRHRDGRLRSGVVLSDGLLITAAEIEAMEAVPELVFLNCCHLAKIDDPTVRDGNKLAASVARELIQIGVRCVIVAGWAVNDAWALVFGQAFYEQLLLRRRSFGDAVFEARKAVWEASSEDITWGAFQAYGDPGWLADPRGADAGRADDDDAYASADELLDELARARADLSRKRDKQTEREGRARAEAIEHIVKHRCPPGWLALPEVQSALGATWGDLGRFEEARKAYLLAIQGEDKVGRVPIKDIEQLANVEARLAERRAMTQLRAAKTGEARPAATTEEAPEALIDLAIARLEWLDRLVSATADPAMQSDPNAKPPPTPPEGLLVNAERAGLRGSAYKRKANLYALRLLTPGWPADKVELAEAMRAALVESVEAYSSAAGVPGEARFTPYGALNRLALDALTPWDSEASRAAAIALARQSRQAASQAHERNPNVWDAVMQAEALLIERLIDGGLGGAGEAGEAVLEELVRTYTYALANVTIKPSELDSVVSQMEMLSRFYDAMDVAEHKPTHKRTADRLLKLMQRLHPSRPGREDRPTDAKAPTDKAVPKAARAATAKPRGAGAPAKKRRGPRKA